MMFPEAPAAYLQDLPEQGWRGCEPELFHIVRKAYESPGRVYHSWAHVEMCLLAFRQVQFVEPRTVLLALLFHDAVYVAGDPQNEMRSAEFAQQSLQRYSNLSTGERDRVVQLIMLTASHHSDVVLDADAAAFIDIDLAVLGSDWPCYQTYALGVEREYCPAVVSLKSFRAGRRGFLQRLLSQPFIFLTPDMRERCEASARRNLQREMDELLV